jgi:hypothetical protein
MTVTDRTRSLNNCSRPYMTVKKPLPTVTDRSGPYMTVPERTRPLTTVTDRITTVLDRETTVNDRTRLLQLIF